VKEGLICWVMKKADTCFSFCRKRFVSLPSPDINDNYKILSNENS